MITEEKLQNVVCYRGADEASVVITAEQISDDIAGTLNAISDPSEFKLPTKTVTYSVSMKRLEGAIELSSTNQEDRLPQVAIHGIVNSLPCEAVSFFQGVLHDWGFSDYKEPSEYEIQLGKESLGRYDGNSILNPEETYAKIHLICQLFSAVFPIGSNFVKDRTNDGYYSMGVEHSISAQPFWKAATLRSFLMQGFGFYRKDLAKLVLQSDASVIDWVATCSQYLTNDQVIRVFREIDYKKVSLSIGYLFNYSFLDGVLTAFTHPTTRYNLACGKGSLHILSSEDIPVFIALLQDQNYQYSAKARNWKEVHTLLSEALFKTVGGNLLEGCNQEWEKLHQKTYQGYEVIVLQTCSDYLSTAQEMDLCISKVSYMRGARDNLAYHVRFDKRNEPQALIELVRENSHESYELGQFKGKHNDDPPSDLSLEGMSEWLESLISLKR